MTNSATTETSADDFRRELTSLRREFHKNPELGFSEFWTTARICEYLDDLGYDLTLGKDLFPDKPPVPDRAQNERAFRKAEKKLGNSPWPAKMEGRTGVAARLKSGKKGPATGFRFDIDALPIRESQNPGHKPFRENFASDNGKTHACGHDGHIAIGLGLAKKIKQNIGALKGEYCLFFQPAEEISMGGKLFSRLEAVKRLDYFFPIHAGITGVRNMVCAMRFLASRRYRVIFRGKSSHAGVAPEKGENALLAACVAVGALHALPRSGEGASRINVGKFFSDNAVNIIADRAEFTLDIRGQSDEICDRLLEQAENVVRGAALTQGAKAEMSFITEAISAENSPDLIPLIKRACLKAGVKEEDIVESLQIYGSEDATFIMREVSGRGGLTSYIGFGSPVYGGHHNPEFDFDEDILWRAVNILWNLIGEIIT